jgi:hypothetical protein
MVLLVNARFRNAFFLSQDLTIQTGVDRFWFYRLRYHL